MRNSKEVIEHHTVATANDGFWNAIPESLNQWDLNWLYKVENFFDASSWFWTAARWLTDTPRGIIGFYCVVIMLWYYFVLRKRQNSFLGFLGVFLLIIIAMGLSELMANAVLKNFFGRLKPGIYQWIEGVKSPLSFPSAHAFNTTFFVCFTALLSFYAKSRWLWIFWLMGLPLIVFVALSRVVFGVHFPSDVIGGVIFGALWAVLLSWPSWYLVRKLIQKSYI